MVDWLHSLDELGDTLEEMYVSGETLKDWSAVNVPDSETLSQGMEVCVIVKARRKIDSDVYQKAYRQIVINDPNRMWRAILSDCIVFPHMPYQHFSDGQQ